MTCASYDVTMAPGCHTAPSAPLIGSFSSLADAIREARSCDRYCVEYHGRCVYLPPQRGGRYGAGRYGAGARKGEPSVAQLVWAAKLTIHEFEPLPEVTAHLAAQREHALREHAETMSALDARRRYG